MLVAREKERQRKRERETQREKYSKICGTREGKTAPATKPTFLKMKTEKGRKKN